MKKVLLFLGVAMVFFSCRYEPVKAISALRTNDEYDFAITLNNGREIKIYADTILLPSQVVAIYNSRDTGFIVDIIKYQFIPAENAIATVEDVEEGN